MVNKAIWVFEKNLESARRIGYENPFVEQTREALARLQSVSWTAARTWVRRTRAWRSAFSLREGSLTAMTAIRRWALSIASCTCPK